MQELDEPDANVTGNFICAKPDNTVFNIDSTQAIPQVLKLT